MSKVLLVLPPNYCYSYSFFPLGTPMLAGYLKSCGIEAEQRDYNLGYLQYWKEKTLPAQIASCVSTSEVSDIMRQGLNRLFGDKKEKGYYYSGLLPSGSEDPYGDLGNSSFAFAENLLSSPHLFRYLEDKEENTFLSFFIENDILKEIRDSKADMVGLSIIAPSQALAAFTLGFLIKQHLPQIYVVIGGQWTSLYRDVLETNPQFGKCFDGLIYFEGETPLCELVLALKKTKPLSEVPNLIYFNDGAFRRSLKTSREDLDRLACPDFDGIDLNKYCASQNRKTVSLTYQSARECYWNKCAYCVDLPLPKQGYRERSIDLVIDDIKTLIKRYSLGFLEISNATMSPRQMEELSKRIIKEKLNCSWWCWGRPEEGFSPRIFQLARAAGCEAMNFGLESANQRVLDFVKKGIKLDGAKRVIVDCHAAGIAVVLQMMMGLPGEKAGEALDTIGFLIENCGFIDDAVFNSYYLTPACSVFNDPGSYGIELIRRSELPFKFFQEFNHKNGELGASKCKAYINLYHTLLAKKLKKKPARTVESDPAGQVYNISFRAGRDSISFEARLQKELR